MYFFHRDGWYCQFLDEDLNTHLQKTSVETPAKVVAIAMKSGYVMNEEGKRSLDHAIETGRGGVWLQLTDEQYRKLKEK
jgi:hypothetical protein